MNDRCPLACLALSACMQIDQRSGAWQCFFCGHSGGDAGSLSLLDYQVNQYPSLLP